MHAASSESKWLCDFARSAQALPVAVSLSDLRLAGNPLVYVNLAFCNITGYCREEALGRNCRFLQGPDTEPEIVAILARAVRHGEGCNVRITNYKRDGEAFPNVVALRVVVDANGVPCFCIGLHYDLREASDAAVDLEALTGAIADLVPTRLSFSQGFRGLALQDGPQVCVERHATEAQVPVSNVGEYHGPELPCLVWPWRVASCDDARDAAQGAWHEADAYTKLMWWHHGTVDFVRRMLELELTGPYWRLFMREMRRTAPVSLDFCITVGRRAHLSEDEWRRLAFLAAERYLRLDEVDGLEEVVVTEHEAALARLTADEFPAFLASDHCTELIHRLRQVPAPPAHAFLFPPAAEEQPEDCPSEDRCLHYTHLAFRLCELPMFLCDRSVPGLPIVCVSKGVQELTDYEPSELTGRNCRILQGPKTEERSVQEISDALREGQPCRVTVTNYTKAGAPFANCLAMGTPLLLSPSGSVRLVAAVIQHRPSPMNEEKALRAADEVLDILASCSAGEARRAADSPSSGSIAASSLLLAGRWVADAVTALKKLLRVPTLRNMFLKSALLSGRQEAEESQEHSLNDVHLMLHSQNTLHDYSQYLAMGCALWTELEDLKNSAGWEYKANLAALSKKYIVPERGRKKNAWLWVVLRNAVYDRLAQSELELLEPEDVDLSTDIDLDAERSAPPPPAAQPADDAKVDDGVRGDAETGSASTAIASAGVILRDTSMLQHVLLRCYCLHVFPTFIFSPEYAALRTELLTAETRSGVYESLEVELESLRSTCPRTSEGWLALLLVAVRYLPQAVVVCDASLPGLPIVGVNVGFEAVTGFKADQSLGKNCSFLQGELTEKKAIHEIREAIRAQVCCNVTLLNYKASGQTFLNFLSMTPIFDADGLCRYFVATVTEVQERFSGTKPQLRQADRLHKLLPTRLSWRSDEAARRRMSGVVRETRPVERRGALSSSSSSTSLRSASGRRTRR